MAELEIALLTYEVALVAISLSTKNMSRSQSSYRSP